MNAPRLLISVRSEAEAIEASAGGADILDIKEPTRGSLGRADFSVILAIAERFANQSHVPISAALGELAEWSSLDLAELSTDLHFVKVGFAHLGKTNNWRDRYLGLRTMFSNQPSLIPAAYADFERADAPSIDALLELAVESGAPYLLLDTWQKDRRLWSWLSPIELTNLNLRCQEAGISLAVAGSLSADCISRLLDPLPAVIAVRGAACCAGERTATIDRTRVADLKQRLLIHAGHSLGLQTTSIATNVSR